MQGSYIGANMSNSNFTNQAQWEKPYLVLFRNAVTIFFLTKNLFSELAALFHCQNKDELPRASD